MFHVELCCARCKRTLGVHSYRIILRSRIEVSGGVRRTTRTVKASNLRNPHGACAIVASGQPLGCVDWWASSSDPPFPSKSELLPILCTLVLVPCPLHICNGGRVMPSQRSDVNKALFDHSHMCTHCSIHSEQWNDRSN